MTDRRKELLLAALKRAGKPRTSGELLDDATGLGQAEGWVPEQLAKLNRKSIAKHLQSMEKDGQVRTQGSVFDDDLDRMTPTFVPVSGFDPRATVPPPPAGERAPALDSAASVLEGKSRVQVLAMYDAQSELLAEFAAGMRMQLAHMQRMNELQEKLRARLVAVGLELA